MKRLLILLMMFGGVALFGFAACSSPPEAKTSAPAKRGELPADTNALSQNVQEKIYAQAIAEYIKAAYQKDKTVFDTLFFGRHVDFPAIALPEKIGQTAIRILQPDEGQRRQSECRSLVYINLFGWIEKEKAQFIFVTFSDSCRHQFDYYIDFKHNGSRQEMELDKIGFELFGKNAVEKPERIPIYQDGHYVIK